MNDKNEMPEKRWAINGIAIEPERAADVNDLAFRLCAPFC